MTLQVLCVLSEPQDFDQVTFDALDEIVAGAANLLGVAHTMVAELQMVAVNRIVQFLTQPHSEAIWIALNVTKSLRN